MKIYFACLFVLICSFSQGSEPDQSLVWNKWDTENFTILSIDKNDGISIKNSVEDVKNDFCSSWGLPKFTLSVPCKILCVPNNDSLSKLFGLQKSRFEVRTDSQGKTSLCAIWVSQEEIGKLPELLSEVLISDSVNPTNLKLFMRRGISSLCQNFEDITNDLSNSDFDLKVFSQDESGWNKMSLQEKEKFDRQAMVTCLMLRKEFGKEHFKQFVDTDQTLSAVSDVYGFSEKEFESTLERYTSNISADIINKLFDKNYLIFK